MTADTKAAALADELRQALAQLDDTTNQTLVRKRAKWAALLRTQSARIAELEAERAGLVAAERERCAKQLDALGCDHCASAIRRAAAALDTEAKP